jgi:hypothetical protein
MTLKEILEDPCISYWLKDAIRTAYEQDPVDALHDARRLLKMLGERCTQIVNRTDCYVVPGRIKVVAVYPSEQPT